MKVELEDGMASCRGGDRTMNTDSMVMREPIANTMYVVARQPIDSDIMMEREEMPVPT